MIVIYLRPREMHNCLNIQWSEVDGTQLTSDDFLSINVSGMKYETLKATLDRYTIFEMSLGVKFEI